jgi:hypothetical protein
MKATGTQQQQQQQRQRQQQRRRPPGRRQTSAVSPLDCFSNDMYTMSQVKVPNLTRGALSFISICQNVFENMSVTLAVLALAPWAKPQKIGSMSNGQQS